MRARYTHAAAKKADALESRYRRMRRDARQGVAQGMDLCLDAADAADVARQVRAALSRPHGAWHARRYLEVIRTNA